MNSVQTGIIKKIIKDSIPELRSAMEEINKIKEDISGIKESLSRIERSLSISCEKYDSDIVQNNITKEEIEDFLLVEKSIAHSIEKPGILSHSVNVISVSTSFTTKS